MGGHPARPDLVSSSARYTAIDYELLRVAWQLAGAGARLAILVRRRIRAFYSPLVYL
jgi:hypothetical protein